MCKRSNVGGTCMTSETRGNNNAASKRGGGRRGGNVGGGSSGPGARAFASQRLFIVHRTVPASDLWPLQIASNKPASDGYSDEDAKVAASSIMHGILCIVCIACGEFIGVTGPRRSTLATRRCNRHILDFQCPMKRISSSGASALLAQSGFELLAENVTPPGTHLRGGRPIKFHKR